MLKLKPVFYNPPAIFNPAPFGFCHTVKAPSKGELVYISGQSGGEGIKHKLSSDFLHQTCILLSNLEIALNAHELSFEDVLKITVLIVDHDSEKLNIWSKEMQECWPLDTLPASTLIPVPKLALDGMLIEVDVIAFKSA
ncbi:RidA family protein [Vibrio anguillarum]|uniref:RidA family protein n=1 Tax=Vibrio anguillarum TaxID=55601 RepID=UPI001C9CE903|nr:RidA family protein [Vibrio anguillarum]MBY7667159.1 RidA family protein [Vibrio anguillarum]